MRQSIATAVLISILLTVSACAGSDALADPAALTGPSQAGTSTREQATRFVVDDPVESDAIAGALERAGHDNQRVLLRRGTASSDRSAELAELLAGNRTVARKILYEYQLVPIEAETVGLTILDTEGRIVAARDAPAFVSGDALDPAKVVEFLTEHQPKYLTAAEVLAAALAEAGRSDKLVFLHSGAPWCGWCRRLETWMARPEIAEVLAKDFVPVKIDMDRMLGAKAINDEYVNGYGGVPWIVILDPNGELIADSFNEEGRNIGSPYYDWEIEYFGVMMRQVARNISDAEIEMMLASFVEAREASGD